MAHLIAILALLYGFFFSICLIGHSFKGMGKEQVSELLSQATHNPFSALLIGILCTAIVQSSSMTTTIVVGFVSGGVLSLQNAIPIIMGSNIGTTVTACLVSFTHVRRKKEFYKAYSVGIVHDIFNILCVIILLPIELATHCLENLATSLTDLLLGSSTVQFNSPVKMAVKPLVKLVDAFLTDMMEPFTASIIMLLFALAVLIFSLVMIVRVMKNLMGESIENAFDTVISKHGYLAILLGAGLTAVIQSSSMTTAFLVTLAGAGIVSLETAFPVMLGANLGTTVTALLAALAGSPAGLSVAIAHMLFNFSGIMLFYVIKPFRQIPLGITRFVAARIHRKWYYALSFVLIVFFIIPILGMILFN